MKRSVVHVHLAVGAIVSCVQKRLTLRICGNGQTGVTGPGLRFEACGDCRQAIACLVPATNQRVPRDDCTVEGCKDKKRLTGFSVRSVSEHKIRGSARVADNAGWRTLYSSQTRYQYN